MLNPLMKGRGFYELQRQRAEEVTQPHTPPPTEPNWAKGSMEWEAQKAALNSGPNSGPIPAEGDDRL
jgi:hypothetical protein